MSKKSQREARERKEQQETERRSKFLTTLKGYLNTFGQLYRQEISDEAVGAYQMALGHLSPDALKIACDEAIKRCKFLPNPAELLSCLQEYYYRQPMTGTAIAYSKVEPVSKSNKVLFEEGIDIAVANMPATEKIKKLKIWEGKWAAANKKNQIREPGED